MQNLCTNGDMIHVHVVVVTINNYSHEIHVGMGTVTCLLDFQVHVVRDYASPCALLAEHVFSDFGVDPYGLVLMALAVLCHPP